MSGYPLQSFSGEKPKKGFPLLSGLGFGGIRGSSPESFFKDNPLKKQ